MIKSILLDVDNINNKLAEHTLYAQINTKADLCFFMERHVFAVLDFMSLLSSLKRNLLPNNTLWVPRKDTDIARFLNEIVLGEETDIDPNGKYISHFELYCQAMQEVGADTTLIEHFIKTAESVGIKSAIETLKIPESSKSFITKTFMLIEENSPHKVAASFCFGREKSIPIMFQSILERIGIKEVDAPKFHYYIKRHIEVDGDEHGPMSEKLLSHICAQDNLKWSEAKSTAMDSLNDRKLFWDNIEIELKEGI